MGIKGLVGKVGKLGKTIFKDEDENGSAGSPTSPSDKDGLILKQGMRPGSSVFLKNMGEAGAVDTPMPMTASGNYTPDRPVSSTPPQQLQQPEQTIPLSASPDNDYSRYQPIDNGDNGPRPALIRPSSGGLLGGTTDAGSQPDRRRTSADVYADIADTNEALKENRDHQGPREGSFWKRLFRGLKSGYENWDGQGGIMGLAANALGTGVAGAASPQIDARTRIRNEQNQLFRELGPLQQQEKYNADLNYKYAQTGEEINKGLNRNAGTIINRQKGIDYGRNVDSAIKDREARAKVSADNAASLKTYREATAKTNAEYKKGLIDAKTKDQQLNQAKFKHEQEQDSIRNQQWVTDQIHKAKGDAIKLAELKFQIQSSVILPDEEKQKYLAQLPVF